jgi:hypothetical protein
MAMTTDGPVLKSLLVTVLAGGYLLAWWAFGGRGAAPATVAAEVAPDARRAAARPGPVVWYQDLPVSARPAVTLPAGWHLASDGPAPSVEAAVPVPVPRARSRRIRTRSS